MYLWYHFSSVQSLSCVRLFATSWTTARQASLSITNCRSLPKPMSIESVMPSKHLILCHPLFLPSIFPSIWVFSSESALYIRWPKYWSFSLNTWVSQFDRCNVLQLIQFDWIYTDSMDCSSPGSCVHGILQARILQWVAMLLSRESSQPKDWTWVSHFAGRFFTVWATREAHIDHTYIQCTVTDTLYI